MRAVGRWAESVGRRWATLLAPFAAAAIAACDAPPRAPRVDPASATLAITNVAVVDLDGAGPRRGRTVLISGDRVLAIGSAWRLRVPPGVPIVDGWGAYLIPGLWDMHVHLAGPGRAAEWFGPLLLANGVTGLRDMGMSLDSLRALRGWLAEGEAFPRGVYAGPMLDGPGNPWSGEHSWRVETPEEARRAVDSLRRAGVDFLKAYAFLGREAYLAVAREARRHGLPLAGHVPGSVTSLEAAEAGQRGFEHAQLEITAPCVPDGPGRLRELYDAWLRDGFGAYFRLAVDFRGSRDPEACRPLYRAFREREVWMVPTLVQAHALKDRAQLARPEAAYLPAPLREACDGTATRVEAAAPVLRRAYMRALFEELREMRRAGLPLLAGTDAPNPCLVPGFALHRELELLVEAGLTPLEALRTATLNPARFLGAADSLGTVEEGKVADLVLLEGDPTEDIRQAREIRAVILRGRLLEPTALDALLARAGAFAAEWSNQ